MKYLFIFPNSEQMKSIEKYQNKEIAIILNNQIDIRLINKINENIEEYKIMCCNEEAIYFANHYIDDKATFMFSNECLEMYSKKYCDNSFTKNGINHISKLNKTIEFPAVVKPDFGFASLGVKIVKNEGDLKKYKRNFAEFISNSEVGKLQQKYFNNFNNSIVMEKTLKNIKFFSVPFIYIKSINKVQIFPILGKKTINNENTDFYWSRFEFDVKSIPKNIFKKIEKLVEKLVFCYIKSSSVNMAEIMYDIENQEVKLVEFSPRVPGGRLSTLIKLSTGIDLNEYSIKLFFDETVNLVFNHIPIGLNLNFGDNNDKIEKDILKVEMIFSNVFNENIVYEFYNKTTALVPGRFAPFHKGHQYVLEKALDEMDEVVVLIFDTDDINVPLNVRANWIRKLYPEVIVVEGYNCPDGKKYAYENGIECEKIQNSYIKSKLGDKNITHVYHSVPYGRSVANYLSAREVVVDIDRKKFSISGTMIRSNPVKYKKYLNNSIYEEYLKYLKNNKF